MTEARRQQIIEGLPHVRMPGISDSQVRKILRDDPATAHIPVIALSANTLLRDIENGRAAGFFRSLTQPIQADAFMDALERVRAFSETGMDDALLPEPGG